jgi:hypothetical protein
MTRGRSRKRHRTSKKSTDENDHSQTGQGEEIATPPAQGTSPRRGRPEEFTEMNSSNTLQTHEPGIGNDSYYAASAVSPNANHQDKTSSLFTIDRVAKPLPNAAQTLEDPHVEEPESQQLFFDCITQIWHQHIYVFLLGNWKPIAMKLIIPLLWQQFNILRLSFKTKMILPLTLKAKMMMSIRSFRTLQRLPSSRKIFLERFLTVQLSTGSQMCDDPRLCFCPCSKHSSPWRDNNNIFIHHDHESKVGPTTPQELLGRLKNEGDSTHKAISIYLETLNTFS